MPPSPAERAVFTTWLIVGALMLVCGVAMARLMWIADGRPPLRRSRDDDRTDDDRHAEL